MSALSFEAFGLVCLFAELPEQHRFRTDMLQAHFAVGRDRARRLLRELEDGGYVARAIEQDEAGRFCGGVMIVDRARCRSARAACIAAMRAEARL